MGPHPLPMEAANQRGFHGVWGCSHACGSHKPPDLVWKESDYDRDEGATREKQKARPTVHSTPMGPREAREEGPVLCMHRVLRAFSFRL